MKFLSIISVSLLFAGTLTGCGTMKKSAEGKVEERQSVLPTDRERLHSQNSDRDYTSEELANGTVKGDWAIEEVYGEHPAGVMSAPYLKFVPSEKRVYGNNGCNTINATYNYNPADSTISFGNIAATMMFCSGDGLKESEIANALDTARRYTWETRDTQYLLHLYDASGSVVMTLMHQNFQFLNGTWGVESIGKMAVDNPEMKLVFDVDEGKVHGNTGCNILNGAFEIDMETANAISFSALATTRRACEDPEQQTALLVALEDAVTARPLDGGRVAFLNPAGETVLTLFRTTDK